MQDGSRYILQNINTAIFKDADALMNNIFGVCKHLKNKLPENADPMRETMTFLETKDGKKYFYDSDTEKCWRMYIYIEGHSYQTIERAGLFRNAAYAFGRFQAMVADYPMSELAETIPNFHNTPSRYADFERSVANAIPERLTEARALVDALIKRKNYTVIATKPLAEGLIPLRVTHNDTKLNNVLMDDNDNGLCVIDLDTVMPGAILYDFGDAIRVGASTAAEDEPDTSKIHLNLDLFAEFAEGFVDGIGGGLTPTEYALLPESALLLTYEQTLRFLGDYLTGDHYYHTEYAGHNLVRSQAQIALLFDMETKLDAMHKIIDNIQNKQ